MRKIAHFAFERWNKKKKQQKTQTLRHQLKSHWIQLFWLSSLGTFSSKSLFGLVRLTECVRIVSTEKNNNQNNSPYKLPVTAKGIDTWHTLTHTATRLIYIRPSHCDQLLSESRCDYVLPKKSGNSSTQKNTNKLNGHFSSEERSETMSNYGCRKRKKKRNIRINLTAARLIAAFKSPAFWFVTHVHFGRWHTLPRTGDSFHFRL